MNWCWNYVTFQRGTRLITGISGSRIEDVMPVLSIAPTLAVSAGDSGSVEAVQTLRHDDLAWEKVRSMPEYYLFWKIIPEHCRFGRASARSGTLP